MAYQLSFLFLALKNQELKFNPYITSLVSKAWHFAIANCKTMISQYPIGWLQLLFLIEFPIIKIETMAENTLSRLAKLFANGDVDHPDMKVVDAVAGKHGVDPMTGRKAFFAGRDLRALREGEFLDGGDGSVANQINLLDLAEDTLRK